MTHHDLIAPAVAQAQRPPRHGVATLAHMHAHRTPDAVRHARRIRLSLATEADRDAIYRLRHAVYATELGQHAERDARLITDPLDRFNHYLVATIGRQLAGFVSVTPPGYGEYSIDKYVKRADLPFDVDDGLFEIRILTVDMPFRRTPVAALLGYAALRWVEAHGGSRVVLAARREVLTLYQHAGLHAIGITYMSGRVRYELMTATVEGIRANLQSLAPVWRRLRSSVTWAIGIPADFSPDAFHGGASHAQIGVSAAAPARAAQLVCADVLDAWFPPSPRVIHVLNQQPDWLARTSPPAVPTDLMEAIGAARGIPAAAIVVGAGLSDLIFRALPRLVSRGSRVLLVEPQYGEYRHVLETHIGCQIDRYLVPSEWSRGPDLGELATRLRSIYDLVVLVNPNNPTGWHLSSPELIPILETMPDATTVWIDETYVEFTDPTASVEAFAAASPNVVVGKSMSKAYALSGLRVGYLCGPAKLVGAVRRVTPPRVVGRAAQMAAVAALEDASYYAERYRETSELRRELAAELAQVPGLEVSASTANFVSCLLGSNGPDAPTVVDRARAQGVFLRYFPTDPTLRWRMLRIAVGSAPANARVVATLRAVLDPRRPEAATASQ